MRQILCLLCLLCPVVSALGQAPTAQSQNPQGQNQPAAAPAAAAAPAQTEGEAQKPNEEAQQSAERKRDSAQPENKDENGKLISVPGGKALGMSILGNQEAPKALVIVPWKTSELGNIQGISTLLDDSRQPIDKEVFMRMLSYYEIRSETARPAGAPSEKNTAQPAAAAQRRK